MGKVSESLPPFLAKILLLTQNTDSNISRWSADGKVYIIVDDFKFGTVLKKFFKGTSQTFIRQLHFYGFKKVEVDSKEGAWGFEHENGLFVEGNTELVKDIRRKTKVDPDSQKLASYYEVQALKSQVSFLQQIIEDLREQMKTLKGAKKKTPSVKKERAVSNIKKTNSQMNQRKRQRTKTASSLSSISSFEQMCADIVPPSKTDLKVSGSQRTNPNFTRSSSFGSLPSLTSSIDREMECFSDLFSDLELDDVENMQVLDSDSPKPLLSPFKTEEAMFEEKPLFPKTKLVNPKGQVAENLDHAVKVISEATNVKEVDVSKIINFLSNLSIQESLNSGVKNKKEDLVFAGCQNLDQMVPLRIQKVGAS